MWATAPSTANAPNYMRSAPFRRLRHPLDESPAWGLVGSLVFSLLAFCLALPLLALLALLLPAAFLMRWLLLMLYWNRRRSHASSGGAESMRGSESRWLGDSWQRSVVHAVLVFETPPEVNDLRHLFVTRVLPACPRLARRPLALPTMGHCWLPDTHFNIENHVFAKPLGLDINADAQLQEYVSTLVCEGLASDKPPWELQVIGRCAVLRVHQSVADGAALVTLLCRSLADSPVKPRLQVQRHALSFYCDMLRACLLGPLTLLFWLLVYTSDCNLLTSHRQTVAGSGSQGSSVKVTWSAAISFAKVTRVKQVTRSTVNCVLLSALSGALRCLLQSCGVRQPPDLKIVVPVELRGGVGRGGGVPVCVNAPVSTEGAVPRLWSARRTLAALRRSPHPAILHLTTTVLMALLPGHFARHILTNIVENKASLQFSSQMGPPSTVAVGGCTLKSVYALLPAQSQLSVAVSVFVYNDQLSVTVATDGTLGPAGSLLLHHLQAQIESLYELLKNRRAPGESKNENNLYRFPDVTRSPVREIAHRLNHVQEEVRRLSQSHHSHSNGNDTSASEPERLQRLKAEFTHLLRELRKRKSNGSPDQDEDVWDKKFRSRRRSMSCSFTRRPSSTLIGLISNSNRPISCIEPTCNAQAHASPAGSRSQARRNTTQICTQITSPSSSSSSTSHSMSSSNSSCNRRTSTPSFSPVIDRQRLREIEESPKRRPRRSEYTRKQPFVKSYSQPSVMPHDVQREITCSNTNLLKAANYHSQPVFRISEESPFVVPKTIIQNDDHYNLRRKLLERNIYPDYNSYLTSRQNVLEHVAESSRRNDPRPVSSSQIYCDYFGETSESGSTDVGDARKTSNFDMPKNREDSVGMQAYPSKYSFDSELYDEILYIIKDNEQLSSLYSGFDSPRRVERVIRTTRIDGGGDQQNRSSISPSPTSSQWTGSESRYNRFTPDSCSEQGHHHQTGCSPKEGYSWRGYHDQRKYTDDEQHSLASSSSVSPIRHRNRSSILGRYRKFFNDEDDGYEDSVAVSRQDVPNYDNRVDVHLNRNDSAKMVGEHSSRLEVYRDAIDNLSEFANTVHKFGNSRCGSDRGDANCAVHLNPKSQLKSANRSASSSMSSLLSLQSYRYTDRVPKSRDVSPSSRSIPRDMSPSSRSNPRDVSPSSRSNLRDVSPSSRSNPRDVSPSSRSSPLVHGGRSQSQLSTLCEETRLKSTLAIEDNQSGADYVVHNQRCKGRDYVVDDQPKRFLRDRQYDKALSYFVTQKINSSNFQNRSPIVSYHSPPSSCSPNSHSYTSRQSERLSPSIVCRDPCSPSIDVAESSLYVPKYKPSSRSNTTRDHPETQLDPSSQQKNVTDFSTSVTLLSSSSSSSNSIVNFTRTSVEEEACNTTERNPSEYYNKTSYSYNNEAYDNSQDKVTFI